MIEMGEAREKLIDSFTYSDLVELKILIQKKRNQEGKIYGMQREKDYSGFYYAPVKTSNYSILTADETREFIRKNVELYKELMSKSNSIEEFTEQLPEIIYGDELDELGYNGVFSLFFQAEFFVDEATALRANAMIYEGIPYDKVRKFVTENNETNYIGLSDNLEFAFYIGEYYDDEYGDDKYDDFSLGSLWEKEEKIVIIDLNVFIDELKKLGFGVSFHETIAKDKSDILKLMSPYISGNFKIVDNNLKLEKEGEPYLVFPNQKKKSL